MSNPVRVHELKTWPSPFADVVDGRKPFEVRYNDRGYEVGDTLILREWIPDPDDPTWSRGRYTGREQRVRVTYVFTDGPAFGLLDGYVVLAIALAAQAPADADLLDLIRDAAQAIRNAPEQDPDMREVLDRLEATAVRTQSPASPAEAATLPPDLLRAALRAVAYLGPWQVGHALHYPKIIGMSHDELHASGAEIQARAREALARLFPEEVRTGE